MIIFNNTEKNTCEICFFLSLSIFCQSNEFRTEKIAAKNRKQEGDISKRICIEKHLSIDAIAYGGFFLHSTTG